MRTLTGVFCVAAVLLAACGEKPQTLSHKKSDAHAYEGTGSAEFTVQGWKAGDEKSWEEQIRNRAQSQNEYSRTGAP